MKKALSICFLVAAFYFGFSNRTHFIIDSLTNILAYKFSEEILVTYGNFFLSKSSVNIYVDAVYSINGQKTLLSELLSNYLAQNLNKWLNKCPFVETKFVVKSKFDIFKAEQTTPNGLNFTLIGFYSLSLDENSIFFQLFKMLPQNTTVVNNISLTSLNFFLGNYANLLANVNKPDDKLTIFEQFVDYNREEAFVSDVTLMFGLTPLNVVDWGSKKVFLANYDVSYNLRIKILQNNSYVYCFFYDPSDVKYPFVWYVDNNSGPYSAALYNNFWAEPIAFFKTTETTQISYIKIIVSDKPLPVLDFVNRKIIDGIEAMILDSQNCKSFMEVMKKFKVQTITLAIKII